MKNIMILEDDLDIRDVMGIVLFDYYQLLMVKDLENWKQYLHENKPDLILLDIKLGVANGIDIARWIKENPDTAHIKIVLTTASVYTSNIDGFSDGFLEKPFEIDSLLRVVEETLKGF
ncbi:response regulator [Pedobacter sp. AW1-32]|uniref:response regulator n=1 Tax=Pedobacter sp. AW1-32 TaxID=3383026 RepID=UPI003FEFE646